MVNDYLKRGPKGPWKHKKEKPSEGENEKHANKQC